jgi:putative DNA primase/helicase
LETELPGILAWIVEGAREYAAYGLGAPPAEVTASTEDYRQSSDRLKEFIEECCETGPNFWASSKDLMKAYLAWCDQNGDKYPLGKDAFGEQLRIRGCVPKVQRLQGQTMRCWTGIGLSEGPMLPYESA